MTIRLNDTLIDFFTDIKLRYEWNDKFYIDFMDYFPLLKQGITTKNTYYKVIAAYGIRNRYINNHEIRNGIRCKSIIKVYEKYISKLEIFKILTDNFSEDLYSIIMNNIPYSIIMNNIPYSKNKIIDENIDDDLLNESNLANSLLATIDLAFIDIEENEQLFKLIYSCNPYSISSRIFNKALESPSIRLLSNVLYNNTEDMAIALYMDEIDLYIGYKDLYLLAISKNYLKIANMLKEMIIHKNLYIKHALINSFENLIGSSDIPDIIYDIIIK